MIDFTSPRYFLLFLPLALLAFWGFRTSRLRHVALLGISYTFFALSSGILIVLLFATTLADYVAAKLIARPALSRRGKRVILALAISFNLGLLALFKYADLLIDTANAASSLLGLGHQVRTLGLLLPIGISFYTFESMSYAIDVYRGKEPARDLLEYAVFIAFFPHLVAGPIVRAQQFLPQLRELPRVTHDDIRTGLTLVAIGLLKKLVFADNLAPIVAQAFDAGTTGPPLLIVFGTAAFAAQIYCDFSGYTDLAIGTARLFGYRLPENFNWPYLATSFRDFWRRWHITLSTWLRDYLYIPLGGSRRGSARTFAALMLTMLLGGLWHGAAWTFALWGGLHGAYLAIERALVPSRGGPATRLGRSAARVVTVYFVLLAWIPFRVRSFPDALLAMGKFLWIPGWFRGFGEQLVLIRDSTNDLALPILLLAIIVIATLAGLKASDLDRRVATARPWAWGMLVGAIVLLAVALAPAGRPTFIYFQF